MITLRPHFIAGLTVVGLLASGTAYGQSLSLKESAAVPALAARADVLIKGKIRTHAGGGQTDERPLEATARFEFVEQNLDTDSISAESRRLVREYSAATATTNVDGFETRSVLPAALRRVVVEGRAEGPVRYSLDGLMTREAVDLLDMPGDPVVLAAMLPTTDVELDESYEVAKWASQMLCSLDIVTETDLKGRVRSANDAAAYILIDGTVSGARLGAPTTLKVTGTLTFDRKQNFVSLAKIRYVETAEIGTISPGVEATTDVEISRTPTSATVATNGVPETAPASALKLYFDAPSWGVRMLHDRDWHVFYSALDGAKPVVILRLLDNGRLLSQMNLAKVPSVKQGQKPSLDDFEGDIQRSLGSRFGEIIDRSQSDRGDGVMLNRVVAEGQFDYKQGAETKTRAMQWTYYLIVHPDGRQLSAIFAHEPDAAKLLADRDKDLVKKLQFFAPQIARQSATSR